MMIDDASSAYDCLVFGGCLPVLCQRVRLGILGSHRPWWCVVGAVRTTRRFMGQPPPSPPPPPKTHDGDAMSYWPCHIRLHSSPAHADKQPRISTACLGPQPCPRRLTPFLSPPPPQPQHTNHTGLVRPQSQNPKHTSTKLLAPTSMSQPMASSDQIGIPIDLSQQGPEAPIKRAPVAKKARAKTGGASAGGGEVNDFDFKFGFNFQSPAKTIRYVRWMLMGVVGAGG